MGCRSDGVTSTATPTAGNNIDISNLANGTYWLRAQADPNGYFAQGGPEQSVTDTELADHRHDA